jgi:predicted nucleotidyltransferase
MEKSSVEAIVRTLNERKVKYLIAGGLAVVAHGHIRFTADVDLMLAMDEVNLRQAMAALEDLGYRPRAPVKFAEFLDPQNRLKWATEKNMMVFSLFSPRHPATEIDLFVEPPLDFAAASARTHRVEIVPGVAGMFCSLEDLIALKQQAGRPRDLQDITQLGQIKEQRGHE